jgi:hypothetical protein
MKLKAKKAGLLQYKLPTSFVSPDRKTKRGKLQQIKT